MTRGVENKILCLSCIRIHVSSHVQSLNKEMVLEGMTRGLKWENIATPPKRSIDLFTFKSPISDHMSLP